MAEEFGSTDSPPEGGHGKNGSQIGHVTVLLEEAIEFLNVRRGGTYIDATLGLGGHSFAIASRLGPQGHLIGVDKDTHALERARKRLTPTPEGAGEWPKVTLMHNSFAEIAYRLGAEIGVKAARQSVDGILADLGLSSLQLGIAERGFSFQAEGPLDMRMDPHGERTADQVVNRMREEDLANVIYEFGEERRSRRIARAIVRARPVSSTAHLARVISAALPTMKHKQDRGRSPLHPATLTFQAIRIWVNQELDDLQALLQSAPRVLKKGGRLVIISFHSLEDRMVKDALRDGSRAGTWQALTKKPVTPSDEEIRRNPRSRSAKLRAAEKI